MKNLKRDLMVVMGMCSRTKQPYGVTVEKHGNYCELQWAFKISASSAKREGYDQNSFHGEVHTDPNFPGCPHCHTQGWYICHNCHAMICNDQTEGTVKCPKCGAEGNLTFVDEFDLKGGGNL